MENLLFAPIRKLPSVSLLFRAHGQAAGRASLHGLLAFLRKRLRSGWRNAVYRAAAAILPQNKLILLSSSKHDKFENISALAQKLRDESVPFTWLAQEQLISRSFRHLVSLARAHVLVIDAASPSAHVKLHRNTCLIHCWHAGGAYKKVAFDAKRKKHEDTNEEKRIEKIHRGISYFVCTSEETARVYAKAFRLKRDQILVFGSPRLDASLREPVSPAPSEYTVLYAPTYRTQGKNTRSLPPLPDANALRSALKAQLAEDVRLVFRGHPTAPVPDDLRGWENWSDIPQYKALKRASVLITDYSSILFDFLPFKRPIIFYVPDFSNYQSNDRELYFSPYDVFPDTTCSDETTLVRILVNCRHIKAEYRDFWQKHMSACDGKATERLCSFIQEIMEGKTR